MEYAPAMSKLIAIIEDEEDIQQLLKFNLEKEGYKTLIIEDGAIAQAQIKKHNPDLVLLDLMLPNLSGLDICKNIKNDSELKHIPIVMLTAKGEEADIVIGLELGADDYVTKPFGIKALVARIRSVLRRYANNTDDNNKQTISVQGININVGKHIVTIDSNPVDLSATEFDILLYLIKNVGWVYTRKQIVQAVHGKDYPVTDRSIDVQITGLRKKLAEYGNLIETVRGVGYRFKES
jgi:DNA-binding response OmpR family regulator